MAKAKSVPMRKTLKKLTTKTILGKNPDKPKDDEPVKLYTVMGTITGTKTGDTQYGTWISCTGNVLAIRASDRAEFVSGSVFLPEPYQSMMLGKLAGEGTQAVDFACNVYIQKNDTPIGYEYVAEPLMEDQSDPFSKFAGLLEGPK